MLSRLAATAVSIAALAPLAEAAPAGARTRMLYAKVEADYEISLRTASAAPVRRLVAGLVVIRVRDDSSMQGFHLRGGRFDKHTDIAGTGHERWGVRLRRGRWHFQSDPHPVVPHGSFIVS